MKPAEYCVGIDYHENKGFQLLIFYYYSKQYHNIIDFVYT